MAEGEEPASGQAGGTPPPPGLGVPGLGVPGMGTPQSPPAAGPKPEIVAGSYQGMPPPRPAPPKPRRFLTASRIIALGFLTLIVLGWVVKEVRQARATPRDKAACSATLAALASPATGIPLMVQDLNFTDDKTLLGAAGAMTTDIQQRNAAALGDDLNRVIHRCNQISSEFKSGFQSFCDTHPGSCKETFHVGPF